VDAEAFGYAADCGVELAKRLVHGGKVRQDVLAQNGRICFLGKTEVNGIH
jgi:hypothetical protein